jgi:uncharacterized RmlC-like cupin family protein
LRGIQVFRGTRSKPGDSTRGIVRTKAFEKEDITIGQSRVSGGVESAWHHHGLREVFGFIVSGRLRFDFGKGGRDSVTAAAGDFFHIPIGLVHRDVNPDRRKEAVVVNVMYGKGPPVVNVDGPDEMKSNGA